MLTTTDFIPTRSRGIKIALAVVLLVALLAALYFFFFSSYFIVETATVVGNSKVSFESVQEKLQEVENERSTLFLPNNHLFLIRSEELARKLKESYFIIDSIKIRKSFPNVLRVEITEKTPALVWQQNNTQFFVDQHGHVIERVPLDSKNESLPLVINQVSTAIPNTSDYVLHKDAIERIVTVYKQLPAKIGVEGKTTVIPTGFALEFSVQTSEGWSIIFDRERPIQAQLDGLQSMLQNEIGEKRAFLTYVDLRVENVGYFK